MGVLLARGLCLIAGIDGGQGIDLAAIEGRGGWQIGPTVARLQELDSDGGRLCGHGDKLEENLGTVELAVLDAQALALEDAEELLDGPPQPVPVDDLPSCCVIGGLVRGPAAASARARRRRVGRARRPPRG